MWLTVNGRTEHLLPRGTFELSANLPHSERYGSEGATSWVVRRHVGATIVSGSHTRLTTAWKPCFFIDSA